VDDEVTQSVIRVITDCYQIYFNPTYSSFANLVTISSPSANSAWAKCPTMDYKDINYIEASQGVPIANVIQSKISLYSSFNKQVLEISNNGR